jgi:hypothetical protein
MTGVAVDGEYRFQLYLPQVDNQITHIQLEDLIVFHENPAA